MSSPATRRSLFIGSALLAAFWSLPVRAQTTDAPAKADAPAPTKSDSSDGAHAEPLLPVIDPAKDARDLADQGKERGKGGDTSTKKQDEVFSEDWWTRSRPILEIHGYFRTRGEFYNNFSLGRRDGLGASPYLWPQPLDNSYTDVGGQAHNVALCGASGKDLCQTKAQTSGNLRLRVAPELHISDNLRILSQFDALDNLVLGSTPDTFALRSGGTSAGFNGYAPTSSLTTTQGAPTAGINGVRNSIDWKRAWAEYQTPVGQIRFGRMPNHWGLGMLYNAGDGIDHDYETTVDRIMFTTGIKALDLYFGGAWDFLATGPTSASAFDVYGGQPYNTANLTNVSQWSLFVLRKQNPDLQRLHLSRGDVVWSAGAFGSLRQQTLDVANGQTPATVSGVTNNGLERRGSVVWIPDGWAQLLWKKLRIEAEFAAIVGKFDQDPAGGANTVTVRQFGLATETEYRAVEDKLRLGFGFGWASGDSWADSLNPGANGLTPGNNRKADVTTFRFNPAYNIDQIFFRRILSRVEGAYYFRPSVDYDFIRKIGGERLGGGASIIWSRASEYMQTPGHQRDLGVELDATVYYQAKDGTLNDDPKKIGGFYAMIQGGLFFPLGGLQYLPGQTATSGSLELSNAQFLRLFLGVAY